MNLYQAWARIAKPGMISNDNLAALNKVTKFKMIFSSLCAKKIAKNCNKIYMCFMVFPKEQRVTQISNSK